MTNDPHNPTGDPEGRDDSMAGSDYQPGYSEPSYGTTSDPVDSAQDRDWEVPSSSGHVGDDAGSHASSPDASPLLDSPPAGSHAAGGQQAPYGGGAPGQQAPYGGPGQGQQSYGGPGPGQQFQGGPPMGGMPPQAYGGGYGAMQTGPNNPNWVAGPTEQGRNTLQLDYWLSVFFSWIPALIFFLTERGKNQLVDEHTKELLNFNITRVIAYAVMVVPFIGWIVGGLASIALFVVAIMGALKGTEEYNNGRVYKFPLTFRFIK